MKAYKIYILLILTAILTACGTTETITSNQIVSSKDLINRVTIQNNRLNLDTQKQSFCRFEYYNVLNNNEKYYGYSSTDSLEYNFSCYLPVENANVFYKIRYNKIYCGKDRLTISKFW